MTLVSVIIPNYNHGNWLAKCLESCLSQRFLKEIIVVDDSSTDNSSQVLEAYKIKYPQAIKYFTNPGKGGNEARNFGFEQSSGDFIQWLDSDDTLLPGKFEKQIAFLEKYGADIAYSDWRMDFYENGAFINANHLKYGPFQDFTEELLKDNWTSPNNYLLRRNIAVRLAKGLGWNPETKIGQDREYFTLGALLGAKFIYAPGEYAVYNKWSNTTVSGMEFNKRLELNQILENRIRAQIRNSDLFTEKQKQKYLALINTHKIKACFYHPKIKLDYAFSPFAIKWSLIHYKMRLVIPFIYINKHINYFWNKAFKSV